MKEKNDNLGEVEWAILNVCYKNGMTTVREVQEILNSEREKSRSYMTVKTMMDRLFEKNVLSRNKLGPVYIYSPTEPKNIMIKRTFERFMDVVFEKSCEPLVLHFVNYCKDHDIDIKELKDIIDQINE